MKRVLSAVFVENVENVRIRRLFPWGVREGETPAQTARHPPAVHVPDMRIMRKSGPEIDTGGERRVSDPRVKQGGF